MKAQMWIVTLSVLALTGAAVAGKGTGDGVQAPDKQQVKDQLQVCDPSLEKECKLDGVPDEIKECVKDMTQAREEHQQRLEKLRKLQECEDSSEGDRDKLREQLKEQLKDQACNREQLRERLREMRECLPDHQDMIEQAKEQAKEQQRRRGE